MKAAFLLGLVICSAASLRGQEADALIPEEYGKPEPLHLTPENERMAEKSSRYLEAVFLEETEGPDRALAAKRRVLLLDPGFTDLAMDVSRQLLRMGETAEAISVLKDAAKASTRPSEPLAALAAIYLRQLEKPQLAEKFAMRAQAAAPEDSAPYQILFEIYKATAQASKLDGLFTQAEKRDPPSAGFWLDLADLRLHDPDRRRVDDVRTVEMLGRAQEFAGDRAENLVRVGNGFVLCNEFARAIPLYHLALAMRPEMDGVRDQLVILLVQAGEYAEAIRQVEEIIRANPLDFRAYDQIAKLHLKTGEPKKALASLKQAQVVAPADPFRYSQIIHLSIGVGDGAGAVAVSDEATKRFPGLLEFPVFKAYSLGAAQRHDEAIKIYERIAVEANSARPDLLNADFYFSYGVSAEQSGRFSTAAEAFKKSISLDSSTAARAGNYLGYMWADRGENLDEAEILIRQAVVAEPENGAYLDSLGWVYFKKGLFDKAVQTLERALELLPEPDPVIYEHMGDAYEKLGKTAEAMAAWQRAAQLDPESKALAGKLDAHAAKVAQKPITSP